MSKIVLVVGEGDAHDELQPCVSMLLQFFTSMHTDPSVLSIAFSDATSETRIGQLLAGGLLFQRGVVFAVPSSPLRHIYADAVQRACVRQPAGACTWVVHATGSLDTATAIETVLARRAVVFPRFHWAPHVERAQVNIEALRFLNFSFTHCREQGGPA